MANDEIEFWQAGEWTMVYLNGELVCHGDHYHADEWLQQRAGVKVIEDGGNFSVPDGHHPVQKLADVYAAMDEAAERTCRAEEIRRQAAEMLAEAERIETGK